MADPVVDALKAAVAAVEEAGVPEDLREPAFRAVLASKGLTTGTKEAPGLTNEGQGPGEGSAHDGASDELVRIGKKLKLPAELVGRIFEVEDQAVHLLVSRSDLDDKVITAQQEITLLVLAARQAAGVDAEMTAVEDVRAVLSDFGVLDRNFSSNIASLKGGQVRFSGSAQKRQFKVNQPGYEAAADIVKRLTDQAS